MQFSEFKTEVLDELDATGYSDAKLSRLVNRVQRRMMKKLRFPFLRAYKQYTLTIDQEWYSVPSDFSITKSNPSGESALGHVSTVHLLDSTTLRPSARIVYKDKAFYDRAYVLENAEKTSGAPAVYTRWHEQVSSVWEDHFAFFPIPNDTHAIRVDYYRLLDDLSADADENALLVTGYDAFLPGVCAELAGKLGDIDQAAHFTGQYNKETLEFKKDQIEIDMGDFEPDEIEFQADD